MNDTSANQTDADANAVSVADIILTITDVMLIVVVTVGNSLTVVAVARYRRLQSSNNVMLAALAVADLIMGIVYTPAKVMYAMWPGLFVARLPCIIYIFNTHFSAYCAVVGISMLSIERGYAVQFPFHYHTCMTIRRSIIICFSAFAGILCFNLPILMGTDHYDGKDCFAPSVFPKTYLRTLIAIGATILILGFLSFVRVLVAEIRRQKHMKVLSGQQLKLQLSSVRCRLMCAVYVSSLAFWMPHMTYYFYITFTKQTRNHLAFRILTIFDLCSSAVNFLIYGFKNSNFRMAYRQLLCMAKRRPTVTSLDMSTMSSVEPFSSRVGPVPPD